MGYIGGSTTLLTFYQLPVTWAICKFFASFQHTLSMNFTFNPIKLKRKYGNTGNTQQTFTVWDNPETKTSEFPQITKYS